MLIAAIDDRAVAGPAFDDPLDLLFVDDDPLLREFAAVNLSYGRGKVTVAEDGAEALSAIRLRPPDIVILDLHMPKVDGFAVLQALRQEEGTRRLPVIVITARDDVASIDRAFSAGASGFLVKPINWRLLAHQIRYIRRAAQTESDLADHVIEIECKKVELERAAADLANALREAAAASEAKSQFLATMSHELRTPLNAVIGFSEILDRQLFGPLGDPRYSEYIHAIKTSGAHLLSLIDDILEVSRASIGNMALSEEDFAPAEVIDEAMQMVAPQAQAGNVALSTDAAIDDLCLHGDRRRVRQVLINLLANAVKFTPSGGAATLRAMADCDGVTISVADTGIGIAEEDIPKALERFGQVESHLSRKYGGAGLGLPLAKQLMEQHGGTLTIESAVNAGTTVTVKFPKDRIVRSTAMA